MLYAPDDISDVEVIPYGFGRYAGTSATYTTNGQRMSARFFDVLSEIGVKQRIREARTRILQVKQGQEK